MDGIAFVEQERVQRQPVVPGGLHADGQLVGFMRKFGNPCDETFRAFRGVGKTEALEQRLSLSVAEHGRNVVRLSYIDSQVEHSDHHHLFGLWVRVVPRSDERHYLVGDTEPDLWTLHPTYP